MKPHDLPHGLCSIDPITLTGLALGALAGGGAAALAGGGSSPAPTAAPSATPAAPPTPTAAAPPPSTPMPKQPNPATSQQSFFGAAATPNQSSGQKTLLGQ